MVRRIVIGLVLVAGAMLVASAFYFGGGAGLDGSEWILIAVLEQPAGGGEPVEAFDAEEHSFTIAFKERDFSGHGPVNTYLGGYELRGGKLEIEEVAHTEIGGPREAMEAEEVYFEALAGVARYEYVGQRLVMFDEAGNVVLRFKRLR